MAEKFADYAVDGIWFSQIPHKHVGYVSLCEVNSDNTINNGKKTSKEDVIKLLKLKKVIKVLRWNYSTANWSIGAKVDYYRHSNGNEYLRTDPNATVTDNLDNLLNMDWI